MLLLEQFPQADLDFLVALPYRTGLWVSMCDESGGDEADQMELQVLESIICGFASDFCKSEITEAIMKRTVDSRDKWEQWAHNIDNVPAECRKGIEFLAQYTDYKNVAAFKENLMEIAFAVAMAYREFDDDDVSLTEKITMYWHFISDRVLSVIQKRAPKTHDEIFNISRAERMALTELSEAVQRDCQEGLAVVDVYADENIDPAVLEKIARHKEEEQTRMERESQIIPAIENISEIAEESDLSEEQEAKEEYDFKDVYGTEEHKTKED